MGDPEKKHLTTRKQNMQSELGSNPQRWDDEWFRVLKISGLNHLATGAAKECCRTGGSNPRSPEYQSDLHLTEVPGLAVLLELIHFTSFCLKAEETGFMHKIWAGRCFFIWFSILCMISQYYHISSHFSSVLVLFYLFSLTFQTSFCKRFVFC